ncbi:molybdopterin converting factor large subunit MoeE [Ameyamaea chiangmaiensis NBRC 103196]|uniref:Molybdopterin synthase catalytic subunit n=1 Tax=Ameyamaea chiangmaiensis TaxID=442969 RepID=A0A850PH38_9PROT|nr:molybdenum cofactor biosynthesis protein MoaE [Ameyamaea chiangmaiensis]MBS4073591.1 molybdenum cofactor biosynthesis protein MoaE [Ameyamaea chiangmaiensis]NVN40471.1 molybdenum cofactor biosynthesis protein MoaE [Ameyamaea chiangmaiensis]GBQ69148.1 molybdopterin converting factor large subunit MoeE [Ameyamaea chiangmaiensis NBRC 103196]
MRVVLQDEAFDVAAEVDAVAREAGVEAGAVAMFLGLVRGGDGLRALTLEHYPRMTLARLSAIAEEVSARYDLLGCTIIHRVGTLGVGAPIVLVLAAARHRGASLEAVETMIDWLKTRSPFWKREDYDDGRQVWVEARAADDAAAARWDL